jgi:hypothetical protein
VVPWPSEDSNGVVITEAGNDPKVAALVYVAAFAPDRNESVETLIQNPPHGAAVPPILPPQEGRPVKFTERSCHCITRASIVSHGTSYLTETTTCALDQQH